METAMTEDRPQPRRSHKRLWCALLSAAIPGLGDWVLGNRNRGARLLFILGAILFCYWPLRLPSRYWALLVLVFGLLALNVTSACLTFLSKRDDLDAVANAWIVAGLTVALVCVEYESRLAFMASGFHSYEIPADSMSPTLEIGDKIVVDQRYFRNKNPEPGEVVVFRHNGLPLIKRIVALGGSTISSKDGQIAVDGHPLYEPYAVHRDPQHASPEMNNFGPVRIPDGQLFLVGDNRDQSLDSRIRSGEYDYGPVFVRDVIGKPLYYSESKLYPKRAGQSIH